MKIAVTEVTRQAAPTTDREERSTMRRQFDHVHPAST
jgi:hypothetical protein